LLTYYGIENKYFTNLIYFEFCNFLKQIDFKVDLKIKGGKSLSFLPLGQETTVNLRAEWPSPSFKGAFLPKTYAIDEGKFDAEWYVLSLSRDYPQQWLQKQNANSSITRNLIDSQFGVDLMTPADTYLKSTRSMKYSFLFLLIPFIAFFLFKIFAKMKVHPFQYFLVGLSNCVFYLLLLSFSEHIGFDLAYLISSVSTTGVLSFYSLSVLHTYKRGLIITGILTMLYIFLYFIINSEDYALLIGSIGVFVILAGIMIITRKINWYTVAKILLYALIL